MAGTSIPIAANNVRDQAFAGGADSSGTADSTAAFQAALKTIGASPAGGTLYVPAGKYKLSTGVTYSGTGPLAITGDGPQASQIRLANTAASSTYFSVTQTGAWGDQTGKDGTVLISDLSFHNDHYVGAFGATNIALHLNGVNFGGIYNCAFYKGSGGQRVNQAIVLSACNQVVVDNCNIFAAVNGIAFTGYCQVNVVRDTSVWTPAGTGVPTAAAVLYQGQTLGTNMRHVVLHDGDRGVLWTQDSGGKQPHIFAGLDVEFNNHQIAAAEFDHGVHVYLLNSIFSGGDVTSVAVPGLRFGPQFQGDGIFDACEFIGQSGHSVHIGGGTGFTFNGCVFGGGSTYKQAPNSYDEISIASGVAEVTVNACHFNVNANAGLGSVNPPRSAVNVGPGVAGVTISSSKGAGAGYGTGAVLDNAGAVVKRGNSGLGLSDSTTASGSTVTSASSFSQLSASITVPRHDMATGKVYKFTAFGHGTQASGSAQNLSMRMNVAGQSLGTFTPASGPAAGAAFFWRYECQLRITATGPSGTAALVSNEVFSWAGLTVNHGNTAFTAFDTAADNALVVTAQWAAAAGAPAITCDGTSLEPVQNYPSS